MYHSVKVMLALRKKPRSLQYLMVVQDIQIKKGGNK